MNKKILAVYDVDPFYAERFSEFINQKESTPFMAIAFTSLARLKAFAQRQQIEILLAGDEVADQELEDLGVHQVVRLSEVTMVKTGAPAVYKYQASDSILKRGYGVLPDRRTGRADDSHGNEKSGDRGVFSDRTMRKDRICRHTRSGACKGQ